MRFRMLRAALTLFLLASCGGGDSASVSSSVGSLQFTAFEGEAMASQDFSVQLEDGSGEVYASVRAEGAVQASLRITGKTSGVITVSASTGLLAGQYSGTVILSLCSDAFCGKVVGTRAFPVNITIRAGLRVSPDTVSMWAYEGGQATTTLNVNLPDLPGTLSVKALTGAGAPATWLSASATNPQTYQVTANAEGVLAGDTQAGLVFTYQRNDGGPAFTRIVPVGFSVGPGLVKPADRTVNLSIASTAQTLSGSAAIANARGAASTFSATSDQPWLKLGATSGTTPATLTYVIDAAALPGGAHHEAVVTLSSPMLSSVRFKLTVEGALPGIAAAMPYAITSGVPTRIVVGGRGFSQITDLATALAVEGLVPTDVRVVSDSEIHLNVPAVPAGRYRVRVVNAAGVATASTDIVVADPADYAATVVPLPGGKRTIIYDPVRRAVYAVGSGALIRYRYTDAGWLVDERPIANILDAALSSDGSQLIVSSGDKTLLMNVLDPVTLDILRVVQGPTFFGSIGTSSRSMGMQVTADGRVWLTYAFYSFNPATDALEYNCSNNICGNPKRFAKPDGERLWAPESSNSPLGTGAIWTLTTGVWAFDSTMPTAFSELSSSSEGNAVLFDWESVYGPGWVLMGLAKITDTKERGGVGVISHDGKRVYRQVFTEQSGLPLRVDVFSTELRVPGSSNLIRLGSIPLPAGSSVCPQVGDCRLGRMTVAPDGRTLFWINSTDLLVMPIPASFQPRAESGVRPLDIQRWGIDGRTSR